MFKSILFLFGFVCCSPLFAQTEEQPPTESPRLDAAPVVATKPQMETIYDLFDLEVLPQFPGGERAMFQFVRDSLQYPPIARKKGISGMVPVSFVIDTLGGISSVSLVRDIGGGCGKEALRLVKAMPRWSPGSYKGRKVKTRYTLPVRFLLD